MKAVDGFYQQLVQRLAALRKKQKNLNLTAGVLWLVGGAFVLLTVVVAAEALLTFSTTVRTFIVVSLSILSATAIFWFVGRPLYQRWLRQSFPDDIQIALWVGRYYDSVRDRLADALQVFRKQEKNPEGYSRDLADASLAEIFEQTQDLDFKAVAESRVLKKSSSFLLVSAFFTAVLFLVFFTEFTGASYRLLNPDIEFASDQDFELKVTPGNAQVIKGEDFEIRVEVLGAVRSLPVLFTRNAESEKYDQLKFKPAGDSVFVATIKNVRQDKFYYVAAEKFSSDEFSISVIERPLIRNLQVKLIYPRYSRLGSQLLDENVGDISALKGTRVKLNIQINKSIESATIVFAAGKSEKLNAAGNTVSGEFTLLRSGSYHIALVDRKGLKNATPIEYRLLVIEDRRPAVQITFPGRDVDLNKEMLLPISIEAEDDFGIARMRLGYSILKQSFEETGVAFIKLPLQPKSTDKLLINFNWRLSELGLMPEDVVTYFAEVFDNDTVSGAKHARSATYRVRFPSIYEMYEEVAETHEEAFESLDKMYEETTELKKTLDEIVQQMKKNPELNWEEKQNVQESAKAQQQVLEQMEELQKKLDIMLERMDENDLVSAETLDKYRELQTLIQEMLTEEMREMLEQLQNSMENIDPNEMKKAMEELQANQEDFLKSMERTLNLLKKLQAEQKLDEALRKAQDLLQRQDELNENASNKSGKQEQKKYAEEQNRIKQNTENLDKSLEDLVKQMSQFPDMPKGRVQEAQSEMEQSAMTEKMQQASQQFQSGQMQSAQKKGQQISKGLQKVVQSLQSAKDELNRKQKQKIMQALKRSSHDLLQLSQRQEQLKDDAKTADRNTPGLNEMADRQQNNMSSLGRVAGQLYKLAQNTFFVTPEIGEALSKAQNGMQQSLQSLEARNPGKSGRGQAQAMNGLNEAASQIRQSMQSLSGASSGIGFDEMMQRMMGLSEQQQGLNQQTQGLGGQRGGLSPQQQAAMQRLAAKQNAVRKSLEQLMKETGGLSDMLGDLSKVGQDMEDVAKELQKNNVGRKTIDRQKKILSRLLDAQRSLQKRDFSKKRKAETAKVYQTVSPLSLSEQHGQKNERLRNELLKAMKEGYSKDYKELIQKYFEALFSENEN